MRLSVGKGQIMIESVHVQVDQPNFKSITADLRSKYAEVAFHGAFGNSVEVGLTASERTLYTADTNLPTVLRFHLQEPGYGWITLAEARRYSLYVAMWRHVPGNIIWESENSILGS